MSHSDPRTLKEELQIRVVALLTGELSEADADELEKILTVDTELAAYRDQMAVLIGNIHDARDEIAPTPHTMRLSDDRRAEIFKDIDEAILNPEPVKKTVSIQQRILEWAAVIAVLFIAAGIFIPTVGSVRRQAYIQMEDAYFEVPPAVMEEETPRLVRQQTTAPPARIAQTPQLVHSESTRRAGGYQKQNIGIDQIENDWEFNVEGDGLKESRMTQGIETLKFKSNDYAMEARTGGSSSGYVQAEGGPVDSFAAPNSQPKAPTPETQPVLAKSKALTGSDGEEFKSDHDTNVEPSLAKRRSLERARLQDSTRHRASSSPTIPSSTPAYPTAPSGVIELGAVSRVTESKQAQPMDPFAAPSSGGYRFGDNSESEDRDEGHTEYALNEVIAKKEKRQRSDAPNQATGKDVAALLKEGRARYLNGDYDGASSTFGKVSSKNPGNAEAKLFSKRLDEIQTEIKKGNTYKTREAMLTQVVQAWQHPKVFDEPKTMAESSITNPLKTIVIPQVNFKGLPLSTVIETLSELSAEYDPEQVGVAIHYNAPANGADPRVNMSLRNLSLDRILELVTQQVNYSYDVGENHVQVQPTVALSGIEQYAEARAAKVSQTPKQEKQTRDEAVSTFSLNVSDVSFKLAQAALENSRVPNPERIRSEEFLNSFDYRDPTPRANEAVSLNWEIADLPYAHGRQVVRFSLQTQAAGRSASQPLNLNLLIDNSGSMQRPDRREIMEQSLQSLKDKLQPNDQLSVVLFARQPKLIANANTAKGQQAAIDSALAYRPEGGTNLEAGLQVAYDNARANFDPAASNRVILMTDGAANLGEVNAETLAKQVVEQRKQGIALDAYGIGWDDYNDELLEAITRNGDGRYAFLNSPGQAGEDFSEKLAGSLRVAAADVKVQITWNPERVTTYRQIGYDLHQLKTEDFRDNTVDAAEIGEAESGTALYVVQINQNANAVGRLGTLHVRYREPATNKYHEQQWPLEMPRELPALETASPSLRLATASALFAERLAHNPYARNVSFNDLSELTNDLPEAFPTQQRVVDLQNMINSARILLGDAN